MDRCSTKQQGYIVGFLNGFSTLLLIDTGADISLMSKEIYDLLVDKLELHDVNIDLFGASGTLWFTVGKSDFLLLE